MTYPGSGPAAGHVDQTSADDRDHLIRSEERLDVTTERVVSGYARLEKFLVTELRTITVEVTHEEVRFVHEPLDDSPGAGRPADRAQQMNTARWIYVNREELVISKRIVPVERVRLEVYPVTEQRQITEDIRKEQIGDVAHHDI